MNLVFLFFYLPLGMVYNHGGVAGIEPNPKLAVKVRAQMLCLKRLLCHIGVGTLT